MQRKLKLKESDVKNAINKAVRPFLNLLSRKVGQPCYYSTIDMPVIKRGGELFQTLEVYVGKMTIRLDFRPKEILPAYIDFYFIPDSEMPQYTLDIQGIHLTQILDYLAQIIKTKKPLQLVVEGSSRKINLVTFKENKSDAARRWLDSIRTDRSKGLPYIVDTKISDLLRQYRQSGGDIGDGSFAAVVTGYLKNFNLQSVSSKTIQPVRAPKEVEFITPQEKAIQDQLDTAIQSASEEQANSDTGFTSEEIFGLMDEAYRGVLEGNSNFALVSGDSGIGKSFSLHEDERNSLLMQYGYNLNTPQPKIFLSDKEGFPIDGDVEKYKCKVIGKNKLYRPYELTAQGVSEDDSAGDEDDEELTESKKRFKEVNENTEEDLDDVDALIRNRPDIIAKNAEPIRQAFFRTDIPKGKAALILKGQLSNPTNFYKILWEYNGKDKVIILDDINTILQDENCREQLKQATDSYPIRLVTTTNSKLGKEGYPTAFGYTGRIIMITNMYLRQIPSAVKGRALATGSLVELDLTFDQIIDQARKVIKDIPPEIFDKAVAYLAEFRVRAKTTGVGGKSKYSLEKFEFRLFKGICGKIASGTPDWKAKCDAIINAKYHPSNINTKSQ